jgi:ketosteroid isomerase-like protein
MNEWAKGIRAKDIEHVLSLFAPVIVSLDLDPPLRYAGAELNITPHGDLAFVHSLNHVSGTLAGRRTSDMWVRWTACFQRFDGVWLVVHDQRVHPSRPRA